MALDYGVGRRPMAYRLLVTMLLCGSLTCPFHTAATSLVGSSPPPEAGTAPSPKDEVVKKYLDSCRAKTIKDGKETNCDRLKKDAVEILKEDLHTLGSSADRTYIPFILTLFKSDEPELRIAAADALGMIGPQDGYVEMLGRAANDPVPDVRRAMAQMLQQAKGGEMALLSKRAVLWGGVGRTPEMPPDPGKHAMPIPSESTYLFFASDATYGRLSYVTGKGMQDVAAFFKTKAKRGPFKLQEFKDLYRDQLAHEQTAQERAQQESMNRLSAQRTDPGNTQASLDKALHAQAAMATQSMLMLNELYPPDLFGSPTVYVLEERQIGNLSYPTRYVVLYQDLALKRSGFRLCWMTVSDEAMKSEQAKSTASRTRQEKQREDVGLKKKGEQEQKKFKQEQSDLEKQLGF
jgi:hypothetical protein